MDPIDNAIRFGGILEEFYRKLSGLRQDLARRMGHPYNPPSTMKDYVRSEIIEARTTAQKYMEEAIQRAKQYSDSTMTHWYLGEMKTELDWILEKTTDEKIDEAIAKIFRTE